MEKFKENLIQCLEKKLDDDYVVKSDKMLKINDTMHEVLLIIQKDSVVSTVNYLSEYYQMYKNGKEMEEIADMILAMEESPIEIVRRGTTVKAHHYFSFLSA